MTRLNLLIKNEVESSNPFSANEYLRKEQPSIRVAEFQSPVIRVKDTHRYIGVSKSTYQSFKNQRSPYFKNDFPSTVILGDNARGHYRVELDEWLKNRNEVAKENKVGGAK